MPPSHHDPEKAAGPETPPSSPRPPEAVGVLGLLSLGLSEPQDEVEDGAEDPALGFSWLPSEVPEEAGARIDRYRLVELLGEGTFGRVWLALQLQPVQREVALKLLKLGMNTRETISRFAGEQQAMAMLRHPNIAGVLDAGTSEDGRLYFVMDWVDGLPVTAYCDRLRLGLRERISLFIDVCGAIQHAHQKAVIHRDLKPSNILVTEIGNRPVPKVIDFGIAKVLLGDGDAASAIDDGSRREGLLAGTPQYASPEQAADFADADTRSDLYSLAAVLHELLAGVPPVELPEGKRTDPGSLVRLIREEASRRPSARVQGLGDRLPGIARDRACDPDSLVRALRGDLDWILLRALNPDRELRYAGVGDLATDLRRHLAGETVLARPATRGYRLLKTVNRHRPLVAASIAGLLMLFLGLALAVSQATRATRAERLATHRLALAEQARDAAESLLSESVMGMRERLLPIGRIGILEETVGGANRYFDSLPEELASKHTEAQRVHLLFNEGFVALAKGDFPAATRHLVRALDLVERTEAALEEGESLPESLQREAALSALLAAHALLEDDDLENSALFRNAARSRCERWLRRHPDSLWAYAHLAHEASISALERALVTRKPHQAAPHLLRLRHYASRLRQLDPDSAEHLQARGLSLFAEAFASSHLGGPPRRVIRLFEDAAASFRAAYELGEAVTYRLVYLDLQLGAETAAGIRLVEFGAAEGDEALLQRGRETLLAAHARRRELAHEDNAWMEWWKDLAISSKHLVTLARHHDDPEEARLLVSEVLAECERIAKHNSGHARTSITTAQALLAALRWQEQSGKDWEEDDINALSLAAVEWSRATAYRPHYYNAHKDFRNIFTLFESAFDKASPELNTSLFRSWRETGNRFGEARRQHPDNPAAECAFQTHLVLSPRLRSSRRAGPTSAELFPGFYRNALRVASEVQRRPDDTWTHGYSLLAVLGNELRHWLESGPEGALGEDYEERLGAMRRDLERDLARLPPPGEIETLRDGVQAWGLHWHRSLLEAHLDPAAAEAARRAMIEIYWRILALEPGRETEILLQNTLLDPHVDILRRSALARKAEGDVEGARRDFAELAKVRAARSIGLSAPHHRQWAWTLQHLALLGDREAGAAEVRRLWTESQEQARRTLALDRNDSLASILVLASDSALFAYSPKGTRTLGTPDFLARLETLSREPLAARPSLGILNEVLSAYEPDLRARLNPEDWQRLLHARDAISADARD